MTTNMATLYSRVTWRILPVLLLAYIVAYIDRVNVGFAKLQMADALGFSDAVFGLGAGVMFLGYFLFEIPSNLALERVGVRKTILRIMVLWGCATLATVFVTTPAQFYLARFLLGAFEAGLFPGVILYLTRWFPESRRGRVISLFMSGALFGNVLAGPLSGAAMKFMDGLGGLAGWQWLYVTQGLPAIVLGLVVYFWLQDSPQQAHWLSAEEKALIQRDLASDAQPDAKSGWRQILEVFRDIRFCGLILIDFLLIGASYTMVFWVPTLIKGWGETDVFVIGLLSSLPSLLGIVGMFLIGRSSDQMQERRWHFVVACAVAALGLWLTTVTQGQLVPSLIALCIASLGMAATLPLLITTATERLPARLAAVGIPTLTSLSILGAAISPAVTGIITAKTGSTTYSMYLVVGLFVLSGVLMLVTLPKRRA
jgi:D-galactonate transporter